MRVTKTISRIVSVGVGARLLIGFWITIGITLACVWLLVKWTSSELDIAKIDSSDTQRLTRVAARVTRSYEKGDSLERIVAPSGRGRNYSAILFEVQSGRLFARAVPFKDKLERDVSRLSDQRTPLSLKRSSYSLWGPKLIQLGNREYLLFVFEHQPHSQNPTSIIIVLLAVLFGLSLIFSIIFTKSLLRPIGELRKTALDLASGKRQARVNTDSFGKDELGELAFIFNKMAHKIDENWNSQQRLLADVSHELRSPLARLNMAVALAEKASEHTDTAQKSFLRIEKETAKMDKLIGDVLTLSRTEAGMVRTSSMSLELLLHEILQNGQFEAVQKELEFTIPTIPHIAVIVQKEAMQSAIENIIRNAIRYTRTKVEVTVTANDEQWQVCVCDDGPGIQEADLQAIFTPFYRSDNARSSHTGGIGLGLAIANAAVKNHNGEISAKNRTQGGACVVVSVPVNSQ